MFEITFVDTLFNANPECTFPEIYVDQNFKKNDGGRIIDLDFGFILVPISRG